MAQRKYRDFRASSADHRAAALKGGSPRGALIDTERDERLIKVKLAAEMLCIAPVTLYHLAANGKIPCVRVGRCVRFRYSDIRKVVNS